MSIFVSGLDLGQLQDHTALVVIEARGEHRMVEWVGPDPEVRLPTTKRMPVEMMPLAQVDVRYIERFPLHTKYKAIHLGMHQRLSKVPQPRYLALDQTGVGNGVIEIFEDLSPIGITFVANGAPKQVAPQSFHVSKRDLIGVPQVLLQNHVMRISTELPHADLLVKECQAFKMKISLGGHDTYEAWRERDHDDLVNALAIACWTATQIISVNALNTLRRIENESRGEPPIISPY